MSVGFGFSAGDFIAALGLISQIIHALDDIKGAGHEYRELISELQTLETALTRVKGLEVESEQHSQLVALRQAAGQCLATLDQFKTQCLKQYDKSLQKHDSRTAVVHLKDAFMKAKWGVSMQDKLTWFKANIAAHTASINMLLLTVQFDSASFRERRRVAQHGSLTANLEKTSTSLYTRISEVYKQGRRGVEVGKEILEVAISIMKVFT
ncbi:hypothetical protein K491DRAFT_719239 [Lophiostoma macrostomum CBS 122681]|uniref:Uncharacterized protein n=1 Tax=Lophiostoma macrostomum CBS 122681 TaxID=1314788 RepID=A0A6A6SYM3_9PLEO|nr:hypothetical protein K491DRAFT_719239 [Lophiostoma macrostomum CBS 122681]